MSTDAPTSAPAPASGAASDFVRLPPVKLDNIEILTGHDNYEDWAEQMTVVLDALQLSEIVIEGRTVADNETALRSQALLLLIQVISKPIMKLVSKKRDPHLIWTYLRESYHRDTAFSFVQQIMNFTSLPTTYDPAEPLGIFIDRFETEWARLQSLTSGSTDTYRTKFREFLEEDKAKRDFLLGFLVKHHQNVVDNLTTKDSLSYSDVVQKLHSLSSNELESSSSVAYKVNQQPARGKKKNSDSTNKKECTYCKAHKLGSYVGHVWNDCRKLKAKQEADRDGKKKETANVAQEETLHHALRVDAVSDPSVIYTWIFDTGASSHMTFNKGLFHSLADHHGYVKVGGGRRLRIKGKGVCWLNCRLPDGSTSRIRLNDVLWVPELDESLFSWRAVRRKGFMLIDEGNEGIEVRKNGKLVLWANDMAETDLFYVPESIESANVTKPIAEPQATAATHVAKPAHANEPARLAASTFHHWHSAFGHVSPTSLRHKDYYADGHLIPAPPTNFHCEPCSLAKSTHSTPAPVLKRATRKLELIHSDLSGKFHVPSYGNKNYYMTLVDDYTRATWVYFLKEKSDAAAAIKDFVAMCERQHGKVLRFRTDNGGEYVNKELKDFFAKTGIKHDPTPPNTHESNGVAERLNRTLWTMARCMTNDVKDQRLWAEAIQTAVYLKNRLPHAAVKDQTPYEAFRSEKPTI
jgi:transposase InsO family protein